MEQQKNDEQQNKETLTMLDDEKAERINELKEQIKEKKERIESLENGDDYDNYNDMLDDCSPIVKIGNLEYSPSYVLKNVDEIAYNCGYNEYIDSEISDLNSEIEDLESEIKDIINEVVRFIKQLEKDL